MVTHALTSSLKEIHVRLHVKPLTGTSADLMWTPPVKDTVAAIERLATSQQMLQEGSGLSIVPPSPLATLSELVDSRSEFIWEITIPFDALKVANSLLAANNTILWTRAIVGAPTNPILNMSSELFIVSHTTDPI